MNTPVKRTRSSLAKAVQAGPIFDHSLALEMLGFFSEDMMAGVEGLRKKEKPRYPSTDEAG